MALTVVFVRTLAVYAALIVIMRFLGKRQIGEMQVSELVTAFLLSELAGIPLTNTSVPLAFAFVPVVTLVCLEVIFSFLPTKIAFLKRLLDGKPSMIIEKGKINRREMLRMRMSAEELFCELRIAGYRSPEEIEYAILEANGKLSFFAKENAPEIKGIAHPVIIDGKTGKYSLEKTGKDVAWLERELKKRNKSKKEIFIMTVDDGGKTKIITKKETEE
jgi:uncharacterized membrane protein YcaP (DUF421 family)